MQTASDVKVKEEEPVEVDSSPPSSPDSYSGDSENYYEPLVRGKVGQNGRKRDYTGGGGVVKRVDPQTVNLTPFFSKDTPPRISGPTPTIVRPGSLPLHLGFDALQPTMPSPTSVITQAPPSNRNLG